MATENDSVYALSASSGAVLWTRHLASPVPSGLPCGNISPSGITGTPVADPATGQLWVVTFTAQPAYQHTLWDLDLATGRTAWQRSIDLSGSDPAGPAAARGADAARLAGVRAVRRPVRRLLGLQGTRRGSARRPAPGRWSPSPRRTSARRASGPRPESPRATAASTWPPATACRMTRSMTPTACCGSARTWPSRIASPRPTSSPCPVTTRTSGRRPRRCCRTAWSSRSASRGPAMSWTGAGSAGPAASWPPPTCAREASAATRWTAARSCSPATPACGPSRSPRRPRSTSCGR